MAETPVWFDNLVYWIKDTGARVFHGRPYLDKVCGQCGEKRYNHIFADIRKHPTSVVDPRTSSDPPSTSVDT